MTAEPSTLAQRVAEAASREVIGRSMAGPLAEFVLAAEEFINGEELVEEDRYDAALAARASALGVEP